MFQWAAAQRPEDWKPTYYLGLIYWGLRRDEDAEHILESLGDRPDYAPAYITRAFLERGSAPAKAQADFERAFSLDKQDWRNWYHLASFDLQQGSNAKALSLAVQAYRQFPGQDAIKVLAARAYLENGRYQDCNSVLGGATILPFEGQSDVHSLFVQCLVSQAMTEMKAGQYSRAIDELQKSRAYPERLGTGAPENPNYGVQDSLLMFCYRESGAPAQAAEARARIRSAETQRVED